MEETIRLFDQDARLTEFDGVVVSCEEDGKLYKIILDQTAFFPEEGGQTCDKGTINGVTVEKVLEKNRIVMHWLKTPFEVGQRVHGQIDWQKRFSDMQQHSGEHIISGLVHKWYGLDNVGFRLGSEYVTMDFNGVLTMEQIREVEREANAAIFANLPILVTFPSKEELAQIPYRSKKELDGKIRIVEIPGYDICACCAPHMRSTGEIGLLKLVQMEKYKGGVRVYMLCGYRALADYQEKETSVREISGLLSAKPDKVSEAVAKQKEELAELRQKYNEIKTELLMKNLDTLPKDRKHMAFFDDKLDKTNTKRVWNELCARYEGLCGCFAGDDVKGYSVMLGSRTMDTKEAGQKLFAAFGGRGGGSRELFQGNVKAARAQIEEWFVGLD